MQTKIALALLATVALAGIGFTSPASAQCGVCQQQAPTHSEYKGPGYLGAGWEAETPAPAPVYSAVYYHRPLRVHYAAHYATHYATRYAVSYRTTYRTVRVPVYHAVYHAVHYAVRYAAPAPMYRAVYSAPVMPVASTNCCCD